MLLPVFVFLVIVMICTRKTRGPCWALAIAWLVSLTPITTGMLHFNALEDSGFAFSGTLIACIGAFVSGAVFYLFFHPVIRLSTTTAIVEPTGRPMFMVRLCWWIGMAGAMCVVIDFFAFGGTSLSDLGALRDTYVEKTSSSIFAQIGSVMTWACLYCYIFVLLNRQRLGRVVISILLLPIGGYFLLSLLSAGRQAAFQVMLATGLTVATAAARRRLRVTDDGVKTSSRVLVASVSAAMIAYMGYIAVFRKAETFEGDKADLLLALFDFKLSPALDSFARIGGDSIRAVIVEALAYFSSSIALFQKFLTVNWSPTFGAMTVPFVMRQIQALTGVAPADEMARRVATLDSLGVIGAGWTTAFASYLTDFGPGGTILLLLVSGYYSSYAWRKALTSNYFEDVVIGIVVLMAAVYTPLLPATSDTNLLLLWLFCLARSMFRVRDAGRKQRAIRLIDVVAS